MSLNHTHISAKLANNFFFRKLFLLRKLFLTKVKSTHYGQMAEDVALRKFFPKKYKGIFVDVGCFHPMKYNNTYQFYKRGWRGINIDIDPIKIEGFRLVRPKDTNIVTAISDQEGEVTYYSNGFYSPTITLEQSFADSKEGKKYQYKKKTTKAQTLSNVIDATPYKDQKIDLLSVDVESHDYYVLKSLDFDRYSPHIIAVESQYDDFSSIQNENTYQLLSQKGYELVNWVGMTLIFRKKEDNDKNTP